jgi:hypothetical protein
MKLRKNLTAKIAAILASAVALGAILGLVHRNPPVSNTDAAPANASTVATNTPKAAKSTSQPKQSTPKRHTRTHVS